MSVALAVALLALLVAAFTLVALVAVYARVRGLEAASGDTGLSGYATLVGSPRTGVGAARARRAGAASSPCSTATARSAPPSSRL